MLLRNTRMTWVQSKKAGKSEEEVLTKLKSPKRKIVVLEGTDVNKVKRRARRRRRILKLTTHRQQKNKEEEISPESSDGLKASNNTPISAGGTTGNTMFTFSEKDTSKQRRMLALFTDVRADIPEEKISPVSGDGRIVPANTPMSAGAINEDDVFKFDEEAMMRSLDLGEGNNKVCMSPKHEKTLLKQFLHAHPELDVDIEKLQKFADKDLFQWWMFTDCSVAETLLGMKGLVERALKREEDLD